MTNITGIKKHTRSLAKYTGTNMNLFVGSVGWTHRRLVLYRGDLGVPIGGMTLLGWWPGSLFKYLSDHAEIIQWSGVVNYNYNEPSPSMGSGHFSGELDGKAASFIDCFGFDENGYVYEEYYTPITFEDKPDCYDVSKWYETKHSARRHFFYSGPGGCSDHKWGGSLH